MMQQWVGLASLMITSAELIFSKVSEKAEYYMVEICCAKAAPTWQKQLGKTLVEHLTSCGFNSCLRGGRMYYNTRDMLWRRKLEEQADLQQALVLQSRRLMSLQLLDIKKQHQRALSSRSPILYPTHSPNMFNQNLVLSSFHTSSEIQEESGSVSASISTASIHVDQQKAVNNSVGEEVAVNGENGNSDASGKQNSSHEDSDLQVVP